MTKFDRRLLPARDDIVAEHLAELKPTATSVSPSVARVIAPVVDLRPKPDFGSVADTQLLFGESVNVYEQGESWAWVQSIDDGYVGYLAAEHLRATSNDKPTHRITTLGSNRYRVPDLKTPCHGTLPFGAQLAVHEGRDGYVRIGNDDWVPKQHVTPVDAKIDDWVGICEMFLGAPYLWGGRSNLGLDCSALIQLGRQATGHRCLRDSDMQEASLGQTLEEDETLKRGDLLFWRGHVGVMADSTTLLHANGHHMMVVLEPVDEAIDRIMHAENSPVTRRVRLDQH